MMNRTVCTGVLAAALAGAWVGGWAQGGGAGALAGMQRMKRVSDPQISPSGKWVMFSVTDVDLEKNAKVNHLWVVPMAGGRERQVTFWKEGERGGGLSPDGQKGLFVSQDGMEGAEIYLTSWNEARGTLGTPRRLTNGGREADGA